MGSAIKCISSRPGPKPSFQHKKHGLTYTYKLKEKGKLLCKGKAVGKKIISGRACIIHSLSEARKLQNGDILIADITNPDWNSLIEKSCQHCNQ